MTKFTFNLALALVTVFGFWGMFMNMGFGDWSALGWATAVASLIAPQLP